MFREPSAILAVLATVASALGCQAMPEDEVRLWHTFGPEATAALNESIGEIHATRHLRITATVLPFGLAQNRLTDTLTRGVGCPDLARIDATWLPGLAAAGLLLPVPAEVDLSDVIPEAMELALWNGQAHAVPQTVDGLALLFDPDRLRTRGIAWPPTRVAALEEAARALTGPGLRGLAVRSDGYWFLAFLRATGADLFDEGGAVAVDRALARAALTRYAALAALGNGRADGAAGDEETSETRSFLAGEVAVLVGGPWMIPALTAAPGRALAVAPYPRAPDGRPAAPRGGQLYVVPRCAAHPAAAFRLATLLTAPERQVEDSRRLGVVPTRKAALASAGPLARAFADALLATRPLPRAPTTPLLFDDLSPAVAAVLAGEATPDEALPGVARAWHRLAADDPLNTRPSP